MASYKLLSVNADAKTSKGSGHGFLTGILYLAPAKESGFEVCPHRSEGCTTACLFTAGRGKFSNVRTARIRKTQFLFSDRKGFLSQLEKDIATLIQDANAKGMIPCVRLNGTSDIGWEGVAKDIITKFNNVQFYDYTKSLPRMLRFCKGKMPSNYHLTFSKSEHNWRECLEVLRAGGNVAAVFLTLPTQYEGYEISNGDETDLRFRDKPNTIIGLKAKGEAKKDASGFVIRN